MAEKTIQSVSRALDILDYIANHSGAGISELSKALKLNKSTVFGLVKTLESKGYIYKDAKSENYELTLHLHSLAANVSDHQSIVGFARPHLEALNEAYGETIHLVEAQLSWVVYIDKLEGTQSIRVHTRIGDGLPVHCTGVGKAILANRPESAVEDYIRDNGLKVYTPNTITDKDNLLEELADIRIRGYSIDNEEVQLDVYCVAAAIRNPSGVPLYALSIAMPKFRADPALTVRTARDIMRTAQQIEKVF